MSRDVGCWIYVERNMLIHKKDVSRRDNVKKKKKYREENVFIHIAKRKMSQHISRHDKKKNQHRWLSLESKSRFHDLLDDRYSVSPT